MFVEIMKARKRILLTWMEIVKFRFQIFMNLKILGFTKCNLKLKYEYFLPEFKIFMLSFVLYDVKNGLILKVKNSALYGIVLL